MNLGFARTLLLDVPKQARLTYCLLRDERVPAAPKAALLGSLGLIASPLDLPAWVPLIGELDVLALGVLAVKVFVEACPQELVAEHREALQRKESVFHRDTRGAAAQARRQAARMYVLARRRIRERLDQGRSAGLGPGPTPEAGGPAGA
ncbi:MAG: YkvA family protein [Candidatus Dormibacterales bacterium]